MHKEFEMPKLTLKKLRENMKGLSLTDKDKINSVICSLVGHSRIETTCWGYHYCARCGDQVGDTLASMYPGAAACVAVGCKCETCEANLAKCNWRDKLNVRDPFFEGEEEEAPLLLKL